MISSQRNQQAGEKRPSAAFPSSFIVAAYIQVRLTPQDFGCPRKRDFVKLNLHLPACLREAASAKAGAFLSTLRKIAF